MQVRTKLMVLTGAGVLALGVASWWALGHIHERNAEVAAFHALRGVARFFATHERGDADRLRVTLDALVANDELRDAFVARDRRRLQRVAEPIFRELRAAGRITHWYFIEPDHTCFLRVHSPELYGDRIARVTLALAARSGRFAAGKELGRTAFALRVVRPYRDADGTLVGYVELAEQIDHLLERMKQETGDEFAVAVKKKYLDESVWSAATGKARNTWHDRPDDVVVDTTTFTEGLVDFEGDLESIPDEGLFIQEDFREGRAFVRGAFPLRDATGRNVGALFVRHDATDVHDAFAAGHVRALFVVLALGLGLVVVLVRAFDRLVFAHRGSEPQPQAPERR